MIDFRGRKHVRVYVAGPYTHPDQASNVSHAIEMGDLLMRHGHRPFIPHLAHFVDLQHPGKHSWDDWMSWCLSFLPVCEAVIRLPGASRGADIEVGVARNLGIPVFTSALDLFDACRATPQRKVK